jgi:SAM-dependent methyltransferase
MSGDTMSQPEIDGDGNGVGVAVDANPVRGRLNAVFFLMVDGYVHRLLGDRKAALFADLPDDIVELGPGTGANLRYYRPGTRLVAIEPNPHMHPALARTAARRAISLDLRPVGAEATGLPTGSVDAVVCTLMLCTVPDPVAALAEARRILRPNGRLLVIEHVAAPQGSLLARLQRLLQPGWKWAFKGCDLCRPTGALLATAGFATIELDRYRLRSLFVPVNEQVAGVATAGSDHSGLPEQTADNSTTTSSPTGPPVGLDTTEAVVALDHVPAFADHVDLPVARKLGPDDGDQSGRAPMRS